MNQMNDEVRDISLTHAEHQALLHALDFALDRDDVDEFDGGECLSLEFIKTCLENNLKQEPTQ